MSALTIVAGPNGVGKTTLTKFLISKKYIDHTLPIINPDEIKTRDALTDLEASKTAITQRKELLFQKKEFVIETTLSGNTEKRLIDEAIKIGYLVRIYFLTVLNSQDCIDRVKKRVVEGGHDVRNEDIIRRFNRSHTNFLEVVDKVNKVFVFDNSLIQRRLIFASLNQNPIMISRSYRSLFFKKIVTTLT